MNKNINESLEYYLTRKTQLYNFNCEFSKVDRCNNCGSCFWYNITIKPVTNIPKCQDCLRDMALFKELNKNIDKTIEMKSNCCVYCIWFEWFDRQRRSQLAPNKDLIYKFGKSK